jgi:hypothetical protein
MGFGEWVNRLFRPVNALDHMDLGSRDGENALMVQNIFLFRFDFDFRWNLSNRLIVPILSMGCERNIRGELVAKLCKKCSPNGELWCYTSLAATFVLKKNIANGCV